jgi:hypothetical protein
VGVGNDWGALVAKFKRLAFSDGPLHLGASLPVLRLELAVSLGFCDAPAHSHPPSDQTAGARADGAGEYGVGMLERSSRSSA